MSDSDVLDTLLQLGREIREAAQTEDWSQASALADRRAEAVERLPPTEEGSPSDMERRKLEALIAQNESLAELFRGYRDEIEDELAQIGDLRHAQDSYRKESVRSGALSDNFTA
jgi:hypothetical protein